MTIIDADKFLSYLIFSKHIDGLTCKEVKEAVEMCKVDVLDKIRAEIEQDAFKDVNGSKYIFVNRINQIINKYRAESEGKE